MAAKKDQRRELHSRSDWAEVHEEVMLWCLRLKLQAHPETFGAVLLRTGKRDIVEQSPRDAHWGALLTDTGLLRGSNRLGRLLMQVRVEFREWLNASDEPAEYSVSLPNIPSLRLLDRDVGEWLGIIET